MPRLPAYVFERAQLPDRPGADRPDPHGPPGHAVRPGRRHGPGLPPATTSTCRCAARPTSSGGSSCPVLGVIPALGSEAPFGGPAPPARATGRRALMARNRGPHSPASRRATRDEAFRVLRSNLLVAIDDLANPIVVVTSAQAGEGKTSTSVMLARSLALAGPRVVLVDLDLRRPDAHRLLGADNVPGVADVLHDRREIEECLQFLPPPKGSPVGERPLLPPRRARGGQPHRAPRHAADRAAARRARQGGRHRPARHAAGAARGRHAGHRPPRRRRGARRGVAPHARADGEPGQGRADPQPDPHPRRGAQPAPARATTTPATSSATAKSLEPQ